MKNKVIIFLCSVSCIISLSAMQKPVQENNNLESPNGEKKQPIAAQRFMRRIHKPINDCRYPGASINK